MLTIAGRKSFVGAAVIGALGGGIAHYLNVPLAWLLGALFACTIAAAMGAKIDISMKMRQPLLFIIGIFLGEAVDPNTAVNITEWPITLAVAVIYAPIVTLLGAWFFRRFAHTDFNTGALATAPGALSAMTIMASDVGSDDRIVAMSHSIRIAILVSIAPAIAFGILALPAPAVIGSGLPVASGKELLIMFISAIIGWKITDLCRIPTAMLIGPMMASIILRLLGIIEGGAPNWMLSIALCGLGASIGCRFVGVNWKYMARAAVTAVGFSILLIILTAGLALSLTMVTSIEAAPMLLAFAPGGVSEMCLIALAIDVDPSFVLTHHLARFFTIMALAPFVARWMKKHAIT